MGLEVGGTGRVWGKWLVRSVGLVEEEDGVELTRRDYSVKTLCYVTGKWGLSRRVE